MESLHTTLQRILDDAVANQEAAGINLLVLQDGKELLYTQSGYADLAHKTPIARDTIFRLYSMSKPVTAAAVMILMERGFIDLCDPVAKYLPGFKNQVVAENGSLVPVKRQMMLHDLLSMTSGLPYGGADLAGTSAEAAFEEVKSRMYGDSAISTVDFANTLGSLPLTFHPGDHFMYGTSADILGAVVEVVSGMSFGDFLKKEIFEPLKMHDTGFFIPADKQDRRACTYEVTPDGIQEYPTDHLGISYTMDKAPAYEAGGAGLVSTLVDYSHFTSMLLHGGSYNGVSILKPATVSYMTSGTLLPWQQTDMWRDWPGLRGYSYGNLMRCMKDFGMAAMLSTNGEYGWDGWLGAYFSNHPAEKLTILLGMQVRDAGTNQITRKVRNAILSTLLS